jgi:glycosyltransferase involved in cell wall biosynthesis
MSKIRIAFDATSLQRNKMGAGVYIFQLLSALAIVDQNNLYYIFTSPENIETIGIKQSNFNFIPVILLNRIARIAWEQTALPLQIINLKIDVLHSPHYTTPIIKNCKSVVTFHDMTFYLFPEMHEKSKVILFKSMIQYSSLATDKIISVSQSTSTDIAKILNIAPTKICTVLSAANPKYILQDTNHIEQVCSKYSLIQKRYLLFVGALEPRKNIPLLIKAYSKLVKEFPNIPLVIVGKKGWMYQSIFELVESLDISSEVKFLGYVDEDDLVTLYSGAKVFIYPSTYEGFGFPVLEAMQCGTPVITSNTSSLPELTGDSALLINPNNVDDLLTAMRSILINDSLAKELSVKGLSRATLFTWKNTAIQTLNIYQSLAK